MFMKSSITPPPVFTRSAMLQVVARLTRAALFGAVLFTASVAAVQPAAASDTAGTNGFTHRLTFPSSAEVFAAGQTKTFDVAAWFAPKDEIIALGLLLECPTIPSPGSSSKFSSITRLSEDNCIYDFTARSTSTSGSEAVTLTVASAYINPVGMAVRQTRLIAVSFKFGPASNIRVSPSVASDFHGALVSDFHYVRGGDSIEIDASVYASDGPYAVSCREATIMSMLSSVTRADAENSPCSYTVTADNIPNNSRGLFIVPYISTGGDTRNAIIVVIIGNPNSTEAPPSSAKNQQPTSTSTPLPRPAS